MVFWEQMEGELPPSEGGERVTPPTARHDRSTGGARLRIADDRDTEPPRVEHPLPDLSVSPEERVWASTSRARLHVPFPSEDLRWMPLTSQAIEARLAGRDPLVFPFRHQLWIEFAVSSDTPQVRRLVTRFGNAVIGFLDLHPTTSVSVEITHLPALETSGEDDDDDLRS